MLGIKSYINESLVKSKPIGTFNEYKYHPKDKSQLKEAIRTELESGNTDLNCIDTSVITDMSDLFWKYDNGIDIDKYNIDISNWNVSNVTDMSWAFRGCENFNCDLSKWDISNVKDMDKMFYDCKKFEGKGLENWDAHNMNSAISMFYNCPKLKTIYGETPEIKNGKFVKL